MNPADLWNAILEGHRLLQLAEAKRLQSSSATESRLRDALQQILYTHANDNVRPKAFYIAAQALDADPSADLEADFREELRADARDLDRVERNEQEEARWPR